MNYTLTALTSPRGKLLLVIPAADDRAKALALSQYAHFVPCLGGYLISPHRAEKFRALYDAGWSAGRVYYGPGAKPWRYSRGERSKLCTYDAMTIIRREASLSVAGERLTLDVTAGTVENTLNQPAI